MLVEMNISLIVVRTKRVTNWRRETKKLGWGEALEAPEVSMGPGRR